MLLTTTTTNSSSDNVPLFVVFNRFCLKKRNCYVDSIIQCSSAWWFFSIFVFSEFLPKRNCCFKTNELANVSNEFPRKLQPKYEIQRKSTIESLLPSWAQPFNYLRINTSDYLWTRMIWSSSSVDFQKKLKFNLHNDDSNNEISALKQITEILSFKSHFTRAVDFVCTHSFIHPYVCSLIWKVKHFLSYELSCELLFD